jgi:hypothetical protein
VATTATNGFGVGLTLNNPWVRDKTWNIATAQQQQRKSSD